MMQWFVDGFAYDCLRYFGRNRDYMYLLKLAACWDSEQ